jgi:minor histocompatibility antigen H13
MADINSVLALLEPILEELQAMRPLLPTYAHLVVSAVVPIYTGAHASLSRPSSAAKAKKKSKTESDAGDDEEDEGKDTGHKMEGLEPSDALMFPLMAGLTLGGLYLIITWLKDPKVLNKILSFYFSQMGLFFAAALLRDGLKVIRSFFFPSTYSSGGYQWKVNQTKRLCTVPERENAAAALERKSPLPGFLGTIPLPNAILNLLWEVRALVYQKVQLRAKLLTLANVKTRFDLLDVSGVFAALVAVVYFAFFSKPWWLTNLLGFSFCYGSLQVISPSTFTTGSLILSSLFLYDIYFVFFTPLMVTVATKLDVPIKMVFPRPASPGEDPSTLSHAMLGLGDIVVPGMMIGLALRFDLFLYYKYKSIQKSKKNSSTEENQKPIYQRATGKWGERFWTHSKSSQVVSLEPPYSDAQSFPKPYFFASIIGYVSGMVATLIAMQFSNHAQPALLYLVPGVLISLWSTAYFRGEFDSMYSFSDMIEDEEPETKSDKKQEKDEKEPATKRGLFARIWAGDVTAPFDAAVETKKEDNEAKKELPTDNSSKEKNESASKLASTKAAKEDEKYIFSLSISVPQRKS